MFLTSNFVSLSQKRGVNNNSLYRALVRIKYELIESLGQGLAY